MGCYAASWNSPKIQALARLCQVYKPEEEFTSSQAKKDGVPLPSGYIMSLRRGKLITRRERRRVGPAVVGVYIIPVVVHRMILEQAKRHEEE